MTTQLAEPVATEAPDASPLRSLVALWSIVWRHKSFVVLGLIVGLIAGGLAYLRAAAVFQSSAQVLVIKKRPDVIMPNPAEQREAYVVEDYLATHVALIQSEEVLSRAAKLLQGDLDSLSAPPAGGDVTGLLRGGLTVSREKDANTGPTSILTISFRSASPADSGRLLKAVIDGYKDFLAVTYGEMNDETLKLINEAQKSLLKDLAAKQQEYVELCKENPVAVKAKDGVHSFQDRLNQIDGRLSRIAVRQSEIETRQKVIAAGLKSGLSPASILATLKDRPGEKAAGEDPARDLENRLVDLKVQYEELTDALGAKNPKVLSLTRRMDVIRQQLGQLTVNEKGNTARQPLDLVVQQLKAEHDENELLAQSLKEAQEKEQAKANALALYLIKEEQQRTEMSRLRQLYDGIMDRLRQINLTREAGGFDARVITPPGPGGKVAPLPVSYALLGLIGGLAAGLAMAYFADFSDRSFRSPAEIKRSLGAPVIGHIPHLAAMSDQADGGLVDTQIVAYHEPRSPESEAFRGVRTSLYFSTRGTGHRVLQITSPNMSDGKSTLAANLAVSIAQSGKRTVLIDADFRRPNLHKLFPGVNREVGVASVIAGEDRLEDAVQSAAVTNLSLLPCGPRPTNPAELLTSPRFVELLDELRDRYDFVLVDTPPVLMVSDPCAVAPRVDGVLLVIRQAKNNRPGAERAVEVLTSLGAAVIGVLVNDKVAGKGDGYGYGPEFGYRYQYGYGYQPAYAETADDHGSRNGATVAAAPVDGSANGHHSSNGQ
jgi:capsular exopolysaccharide synthesis family protein